MEHHIGAVILVFLVVVSHFVKEAFKEKDGEVSMFDFWPFNRKKKDVSVRLEKIAVNFATGMRMLPESDNQSRKYHRERVDFHRPNFNSRQEYRRKRRSEYWFHRDTLARVDTEPYVSPTTSGWPSSKSSNCDNSSSSSSSYDSGSSSISSCSSGGSD